MVSLALFFCLAQAVAAHTFDAALTLQHIDCYIDGVYPDNSDVCSESDVRGPIVPDDLPATASWYDVSHGDYDEFWGMEGQYPTKKVNLVSEVHAIRWDVKQLVRLFAFFIGIQLIRMATSWITP